MFSAVAEGVIDRGFRGRSPLSDPFEVEEGIYVLALLNEKTWNRIEPLLCVATSIAGGWLVPQFAHSGPFAVGS